MLIIILLVSLNILAKTPIIDIDNTKVLYIIDGDSIGFSMRIKGIDTPEKQQKCAKTSGKIINCGIIAKEHLQILLDYLPGKLKIESVGIDYYNRTLVNIYKGDVNVGKKMVEQGMAWAYGKKYKAQEKIAQTNKVGFWNYLKPPLKPSIWRKQNPRKSR